MIGRKCFVCSLAFWLLGTSPSLADEQSHLQDLNWGIETARICSGILFRDPESLRAEGGQGLAVALRILDADEVERHVALVQKGDGLIHVSASAVFGSTLSEQLAGLHAKNPTISPTEACKKVKTETVVGSDTEELERLLGELRALRISPVLCGPLALHGEFYEAWIFTGAASSRYEFQGVPEETDRDNALLDWARNIVHVIWDKN